MDNTTKQILLAERRYIESYIIKNYKNMPLTRIAKNINQILEISITSTNVGDILDEIEYNDQMSNVSKKITERKKEKSNKRKSFWKAVALGTVALGTAAIISNNKKK